MLYYKSRAFKGITASVLVALMYEAIFPLAARAVTGGPTQPEFTKFESVTTNNLVDDFTGSFTYNIPVVSIPGPSGSGYALSLSYHSGTSPEEEASWVGYGWTLNPGVISRGKRGLPDDYNGEQVKHWNKIESNWTLTATPKDNFEIFSTEAITAGASATLVYNNHKGFGYVASASVGLKSGATTLGSLGFNYSDGEGLFDPKINVGALVSKYLHSGIADVNLGAMRYSTYPPTLDCKEQKPPKFISPGNALANSLAYPYLTFGDNRRNTTVTGYTGVQSILGLGVQINPTPLEAASDFGIMGTYAEQTPVPLTTIPSYGYMYSNNGRNKSDGSEINDDAAMDYTVEKESPYTKRDRYLAIPYSQPDNFSVSGEGLGGGFCLHHTSLGDFHPNAVTSTTTIATIEGDVNVGGAVGQGGDFGLGEHSLSVSNWLNDAHSFGSPKLGDAGCFFRYNNDPGGSMVFANDDEPVQATITSIFPFQVPGTESYNAHLGNVMESVNNGKRVGRSSYIGYHTNQEMGAVGVSGTIGNQRKVAYGSYTRDPSIENFIDRSSVPSGIGEFAVTAANGNQYVFGLPVYARNEKNLQYGLYGENAEPDGSDYLVYKMFDKPEHAAKVVGEERDAPYATMYLLTQITTPDYVDRTGNGPSSDDFGGYTKFNYRRVAGTNNKAQGSGWYKWRVPYTGLILEKNSNWDPRDDMGSVMMGEREVYYLESIETKTHIAVFVTNKGVTVKDRYFPGSGEERKDAYPAPTDESIASVSESYNPSGSNPSQRLERIELWSKTGNGQFGKLLQTTNLEYSYELSRNMPNATLDNGTHAGRLTLKRLWTEYNGTHSARISPYIFGYNYRRSFGAKSTAAYGDVVSYASRYTAESENPAYNPHQTDRWGYYQFNGDSRYQHRQDWVMQNPDAYATPSGNQFDPAAWQLKWIRLPSGGEIHVQYEQNDYVTVQDRPALAMVSLLSGGSDNRYYLNVSDLGISTACSGGTPPAEMTLFVNQLRQTFLPEGQPKVPIYFKFLYDLIGLSPGLSSCGSEFISGYVVVKDVGIDNQCRPYIDLEPDASGNITNPHQICQDYANASGAQSFNFGTNCLGKEAIAGGGDMGAVNQLWTRFTNLIGVTGCAEVDPANSYFRVPMTRPKSGGGIRVKRLFTYDPGIETNDDHLYGTEYIYQTEGGTSSGVATNEPTTGREENALVNYIKKRRDQGWEDRAFAGRDREQFEGPIGESFLPAPAVGYSRTVVKGISAGKSGKGFVVNEFYTVKDYPFDADYTNNGGTINGRGSSSTEIEQKGFPVTLPAGFVSFSVANLWMTQGYRFILTNMHGQPKSTAAYSGDFNDPSTWYASASTAYTYFQPGEKIPVMYGIGDIRMEYPGKEMEITSEGRAISDVAVQGMIEGDVAIGLTFPPLFYFSIAPKNIAFDQKELRTYVTTKVVRYPVFTKSVTTLKDGIKSIVDYVGFSPETGQPIATKAYDGYHQLNLAGSPTPHDGSYVSYNLPASWNFKSLGQKAGAEHTKFVSEFCGAKIDKRLEGTSTWLTFRLRTPQAYKEVLGRFNPGDLVRLTQGLGDDVIGVFTVSYISGYEVFLIPTSIEAAHSNQACEEDVSVEIIISGKSNELQLPDQNITTYGVPASVQPTKEAVTP